MALVTKQSRPAVRRCQF